MPTAIKSSTSLGSLKSAHTAKGRDLKRDDLARKRMKALLFDEPDFSMRLEAIDQHQMTQSALQSTAQRSVSSRLHSVASRSIDLKPAPGHQREPSQIAGPSPIVAQTVDMSHHQDKATLSSLNVQNEHLIQFDPHPPTGIKKSEEKSPASIASGSPITAGSPGGGGSASASPNSSSSAASATSGGSIGGGSGGAQNLSLVQDKNKIGNSIIQVAATGEKSTNLLTGGGGNPTNSITPPMKDTMANPMLSSTAGSSHRPQQYQANLGGVTAAGGQTMSAMDHSIEQMIKSLTDHPMLATATRVKAEPSGSMKDNYELISSSNFIRYHGYRMHKFMNSILNANFDLKRSSSHTFDLKIEVENEVYFVHKFIVESQVPHIIDKMIDISDNNIKKASLITRIELRNINNVGFKPIYQFMYGGHVEPNKENFLSTLDAAIRLFMIDFARIWICEFALQFKTKIKWVSTLIKISKLYGWKEEELKMRKLKFKLVQDEGQKVDEIVKNAISAKSLSLSDNTSTNTNTTTTTTNTAKDNLTTATDGNAAKKPNETGAAKQLNLL